MTDRRKETKRDRQGQRETYITKRGDSETEMRDTETERDKVDRQGQRHSLTHRQRETQCTVLHLNGTTEKSACRVFLMINTHGQECRIP